MKVDLRRSQNLDVVCAAWFIFHAALMAAAAVSRPWVAGPYYDMGVGMFVAYGFLLPGTLYLLYNLIVLVGRWWSNKRYVEAQRSLFATRWGRRSAFAFGVAFAVNLVCYPFGLVWS